jgi:hypothetical protein
MPEPTRSRLSVGPFATVVGAMVAVVAVVAFVVRVGDAGRSTRTDPGITTIDIVSEPPGASVVRADDGGVLGLTPLNVSFPKSDKDLAVVVSHEGYQDHRANVPLFSASGRIDVTLTPVGVDAAAVPSLPDHWTP